MLSLDKDFTFSGKQHELSLEANVGEEVDLVLVKPLHSVRKNRNNENPD